MRSRNEGEVHVGETLMLKRDLKKREMKERERGRSGVMEVRA